MWKRAFTAAVMAANLALAPAAAIDGSGSSKGELVSLTAPEAAAFAKQIERDLASEGARVAVVFRLGSRSRDSLPDGIRYTHGAFWVYRDITTEDGRNMKGYAVYNLYHGDGETLPRTRSYLAQDWPYDFVAPTSVDDVAVIVPSPEMQRRILAIIDSSDYVALHNPSYSLIANPQEPTYQNCNSFMLAVIAAAAWETTDLVQIAANLKAHFTPASIEVGVLKRMFGPSFDERLKTDDQHGGLKTATYTSMAQFMEAFGLSKATYVIERDAALVAAVAG